MARAMPPPDPKARVCFRTSLMDLCQIIFLFSDPITKEALILLHNDDRRLYEMEEAERSLFGFGN